MLSESSSTGHRETEEHDDMKSTITNEDPEEVISKRFNYWLINPGLKKLLEKQKSREKRGGRRYGNSWAMKLHFPVWNYHGRQKKMDENVQELQLRSDDNELASSDINKRDLNEISTRSHKPNSSFRFNVSPNSVLRQIMEHFRILQRARMTKRFVEPRIQPHLEPKGPGMDFWKSALQNNLSDMFDDKISVVRLKRIFGKFVG